ncbi:MAG: hypothetical protein ACI9W4_001559 [Rhodothermales bacterium]|jgi:hypothetical protein
MVLAVEDAISEGACIEGPAVGRDEDIAVIRRQENHVVRGGRRDGLHGMDCQRVECRLGVRNPGDALVIADWTRKATDDIVETEHVVCSVLLLRRILDCLECRL